jgi:anti-sigma factor RsiW
MDQDNKIQLLHRNLDGQLTAAEKEKLTKALRDQPELAREQQRLQGIRAAMQEDRVKIPVGLQDRILARIQGEALPRLHSQPLATAWATWRRSSLLAAAALVVAGMIFVSRLPDQAVASQPAAPQTQEFQPDQDYLRILHRRERSAGQERRFLDTFLPEPALENGR